MADCAEIARQVGQRIGEELDIPVYLYEHAASTPERQNLATVRAGEYEGLAKKLAKPEWKPDFGPAEFNANAGATAVGAREFLIAYNINLNTTDRRYANEIAYELRERGRWKRAGNTEPFYYKGEIVRFPEPDERGDYRYPCGGCDFVGDTFEGLARHYEEAHDGDLRARYEALGIDPDAPTGPVFTDGRFEHVKAIGWVIEDYNRAQISMNLTNYKVTPMQHVLEATRGLAGERGIVVTGSEVVDQDLSFRQVFLVIRIDDVPALSIRIGTEVRKAPLRYAPGGRCNILQFQVLGGFQFLRKICLFDRFPVLRRHASSLDPPVLQSRLPNRERLADFSELGILRCAH